MPVSQKPRKKMNRKTYDVLPPLYGAKFGAVKRLRKLEAKLRDDKGRKAAAVAKRERRMERNRRNERLNST
jgi:hypothetical protein